MQQVSQAWKNAHRKTVVPEAFVEISIEVGDPNAQSGAVGTDNGHESFSRVEGVTDTAKKSVTKYATLEPMLWGLDGTYRLLDKKTPPIVNCTITLIVEPASTGITTGDGVVTSGTVVTVTASPADGYSFAGWQEDGEWIGDSPEYTFTADSDRTLTAVFKEVSCHVSVIVYPSGNDPAMAGGTVTGAGNYRHGQSVTLTATPSVGYRFAGWQENGNIICEAEEYTFTAEGDRELVALFAVLLKDFPYSGEAVMVMMPPGRYLLEVWGAQGGYRTNATYGGKGGYSRGELTLTEFTQLFVRSGGSGNTGGPAGGYNGGGKRSTYNGGGGASDVRIGTDDPNHRVIVAGGGGSDGAANKAGGYGGGETGQSRTDNYGTGGFGGTQTGVSNASWQATDTSDDTASQTGAYAGFGFGGNGIALKSGYGGAGGGGWYGGSGSVPDGSGDDDRGGAGGSGFVWTGGTVPSGFRLGEGHALQNAQTLNGSRSFLSPAGASETGHTGDGHVRITPLGV